MEPQSALVGTDGAVHLDAVAAVDADLAAIVLPRDPEQDDALGLDHPLDDPGGAVLRAPLHDQVHRLEHLLHGLMELRLGGVLRADICDDPCHVLRYLLGLGSAGYGSHKRASLRGTMTGGLSRNREGAARRTARVGRSVHFIMSGEDG